MSVLYDIVPINTDSDHERYTASGEDLATVWDAIYRQQQMRWGLLPSLCGHFAVVSILSRFPKGASIIDIGAGYGRDAAYFSQNLGRNYRIDAIDPSLEATRLAARVVGDTNVVFTRSSVASFALATLGSSALYDVIFSNYVLHLLSRSECVSAIQLISQLLDPAGVFIFSLVNVTDARNALLTDNEIISIPSGVKWEFYDKDTIIELLSRCGMKANIIKDYRELELVNGIRDSVEAWYIEATHN